MRKIIFDNDKGQAIEYYLASEVKDKLHRRNMQIKELKEWAELGKKFYEVMTGYRGQPFCPLDLMKQADKLLNR